MPRLIEVAMFVTVRKDGTPGIVTGSKSLSVAIKDTGAARGDVKVLLLEPEAAARLTATHGAFAGEGSWDLGPCDKAEQAFLALRENPGMWGWERMAVAKRLLQANHKAWVESSAAPLEAAREDALQVLSWGLYEMTEMPNPLNLPLRVGAHCLNSMAREALRLPVPSAKQQRIWGRG